MTAKTAKARVRSARAAARSPSKRSANGNSNGKTWPTLLIAGGVLGAAALVALSPAVWSRVGSVVFGTGARLARLSLAPALVGTILSRVGTTVEEGGRALRRVSEVNQAH